MQHGRLWIKIEPEIRIQFEILLRDLQLLWKHRATNLAHIWRRPPDCRQLPGRIDVFADPIPAYQSTRQARHNIQIQDLAMAGSDTHSSI